MPTEGAYLRAFQLGLASCLAAGFADAAPARAADAPPEEAAYGRRTSFSGTAAIVEWSRTPPHALPAKRPVRTKMAPAPAQAPAQAASAQLAAAPQPAPAWTGRRVNPRLTSGFGYREDPVNGGGRMHSGLDMAAPMGTAVIASSDGIVSFAGWLGGYGNCIIVEHGNGMQTRYGHLSSINVAIGARISRGGVLGMVGSTGHSTGPHLHYEVRQYGRAVNPLGR